MDRDLAARAVPDPRSAPRRRDRHGRGFRRDLIPAHPPGHRSRRERFDDLVADSVATVAERFPRRLAHLQVMVEEVPPEDPAPWEDAPVVLGRALPATREHPPRVVLYRRPVATRCTGDEELEALVRQVVSEQIGSLLGMAAEDVDPEAWED